MGWYIRFMHDFSAVPRGKRSVRVLHVPNGPPTCGTTNSVADDPGDLKFQLSINPPQGGRNLDYVDFHTYPFPNSDALGQHFRVCFRRQCIWLQLSRSERRAWRDFIFVGHSEQPGYETRTGSSPSNWFAGGFGASLSRLFSALNAATNNYYSRLQINGAGTGWAVNSLTPVKGGEPLYVKGFIRANSTISNVYINVVEYDAQGVHHSTSGPPFTPWTFGCTWNNYLQRVGSWSVLLRSDTKNVIIQILGTNSGGTGLIDFDAFSAWQRP